LNGEEGQVEGEEGEDGKEEIHRKPVSGFVKDRLELRGVARFLTSKDSSEVWSSGDEPSLHPC
jgi:hypothetical protein